MKLGQKADNVIPINSEPGTPFVAFPAAVREQVLAYWQRLGVADSELAEHLADDCLHRARRLAARGNEGELLSRALEEALRRFDHALARALHLPPAKDSHGLAAARAAALLALAGTATDKLFKPGADAAELAAAIQRALPRSTPPESRLPMAEAPLRFWLFKSPPQH